MASATKYAERDLAFDRFVGTYGIATPEATSLVLFDGKPSGHVHRRKVEEGWITNHARALPGGASFVTLTEKGCVRVGVSPRLSEPPSGNALDALIATLVFCVFGRYRRYRLRYQQAKQLVGAPLAAAPFVLLTQEEFGRFILARVVFTRSSATSTIAQLRRHFEKTSSVPHLAIRDGTAGGYGIAVLLPTREATEATKNAVERSGLRRDHFIHVEWAPGATEYVSFLRQRKKHT